MPGSTHLKGRRHERTARRDRIVIGGSAGSLDTLRAIARHFPSEFSGSIFVVAHIGQSRSTLPELLQKAGNLTASTRKKKSRLERVTSMWRLPIATC